MILYVNRTIKHRQILPKERGRRTHGIGARTSEEPGVHVNNYSMYIRKMFGTGI